MDAAAERFRYKDEVVVVVVVVMVVVVPKVLCINVCVGHDGEKSN